MIMTQTISARQAPWTVVDLFSGAGGFSYGFHVHPRFTVAGAVDAQYGMPSSGQGNLGCNATYLANIGVAPIEMDLAVASIGELRGALAPALAGRSVDVLIVCPPCTGLTRAIPDNHVRDDPRNELIDRAVEFVDAFQPSIVLMENARELISGRFAHHFVGVERGLKKRGYQVEASVERFERFGLPQRRERAVIVATREELPIHTLKDLWQGHTVSGRATTVRRAIEDLPAISAGDVAEEDPTHVSLRFGRETTRQRLAAIPKNGGSWGDLVGTEFEALLIPSMRRALEKGRPNQHGDVYGRMRWDEPATTIKRECSHVGNGRYSHPEQDRACTVREMAMLQGFPRGFFFAGESVKNRYRHIGNAVPPLIAYQLAWVCDWILGGNRPAMSDVLLPDYPLAPDDLIAVGPLQAE